MQEDLSDFKEVNLSFYIPGRVRFKIDIIYKDKFLSEKLKNHLKNIKEVHEIQINIYSKSILINYDASKLSIYELKHVLIKFMKNYKRVLQNHVDDVECVAVTSDLGKSTKTNYKRVRNKNNMNFKHSDLSFDTKKEVRKYIKDRWHTMNIHKISDMLNTDITKGLSKNQATLILENIGYNEFEKKKKKSKIACFFEQFDGFIIKLLFGASVVSAFLGQLGDSVTIIIIVLLEALLGVWQNNKAEKSLEALKQYSSSKTKVLRDGEFNEIPSKNLVPGDMIAFEAGDIIPADCRLVKSSQLKIDESSLTGESEPIEKSFKVNYSTPVALADRKNMVYMGTTVLKGTGRAIVVETGKNTEMGNIAKLINDSAEEKTPLQKDLDNLGKYITWICLGVCGGIMASGIIGGQSVFQTLRTGISLAIGAIPEGLTSVFTISLAFGVQRMAKKKAIIKKLPAVESLSCVDVICTDKTGTLTTGKMTTTEIRTINNKYNISGEGYSTKGNFYDKNLVIEPKKVHDLNKLLSIGTLCNNTTYKKKSNKLEVLGDHTEGALLIAAMKANINLDHINCYTRVKELAFDSEIKKMTVVCKDTEEKYSVNTKGAPNVIMSKCRRILDGDVVRELTSEDRNRINQQIDEMTTKALRVIAFAYKDIEGKKHTEDSDIEKDLIFAGLAGMIDPPRKEVKSAIKKCEKAGVRVIMITGDHKRTAEAIGKEIGIHKEDNIILTGEELDRISDKELLSNIDNISIFARTSPYQKLRIVKALKEKEHIVAMTGDGVNDAPAIKESHIGISMGKNGTNVTRESSSIVLTDDNFITIMNAIEEGRGISGNVKKFMKYVLSGNAGEILAIFVASLLGMPTPLIASQILMVNLITEGIPALSLGVDPPNENVMNEPPREANKSIFDEKLLNNILSRGILMGLSTLGIYIGGVVLTKNVIKGRTLAYANLVTNQMFHVFDCRTAPLNKNKYIVPSVAISSALLLATIYTPQLMGFFGTTALGIYDWLGILFMSFFIGRLDYIKERAKRVYNVKNPQCKLATI